MHAGACISGYQLTVIHCKSYYVSVVCSRKITALLTVAVCFEQTEKSKCQSMQTLPIDIFSIISTFWNFPLITEIITPT